uniref:Uncharacterized protein n=1 Tax=Rhizophora mucronata TaxID=61149 RepID=A0A2P2QU65_RHIMU
MQENNVTTLNSSNSKCDALLTEKDHVDNQKMPHNIAMNYLCNK